MKRKISRRIVGSVRVGDKWYIRYSNELYGIHGEPEVRSIWVVTCSISEAREYPKGCSKEKLIEGGEL